MQSLTCEAHETGKGPKEQDMKQDMELAREIASSTLVDDVMRRWPATIRAFLNHRMNCPGCPIACFHTVADACKEHHVDMAAFLRDLQSHASKVS